MDPFGHAHAQDAPVFLSQWNGEGDQGGDLFAHLIGIYMCKVAHDFEIICLQPADHFAAIADVFVTGIMDCLTKAGSPQERCGLQLLGFRDRHSP